MKLYNEHKFLSKAKEGAETSIIDDIGHVEEAVVIGVMNLDTFRRCFKCTGKFR